MKKIQLLVLVLVFLSACKNDKKDTENTIETIETDMENDGLTLLEGNFISYADAAVFQTQTSLFGVVINEKSQELANQAKPLKKQDTDMVKARVKGSIEKTDTEIDTMVYQLYNLTDDEIEIIESTI